MRFAIVIRKQKIDNPWQNYRWKPIEVIPDIGQFGKTLELAGTEQNRKVVGRFLERDDEGESWLFAGFDFKLFSKYHCTRALLVCDVASGSGLSRLLGTKFNGICDE
jgi:hypothetical protein